MNWPWRKRRNEPPAKATPHALRRSTHVYKVDDVVPGGYRVASVLRGGMGTVYVVTHPESDLPLVLKTYQDIDRSSFPMFIREAEAWINLGSHPHLVQAHWVQDIQGQLFVCAEYVPDDDLGRNTVADYLQYGPQPIPSIMVWAAQFLYGLSHMLANGVSVHRDIKPANIMLDGSGTLNISDFGLVRADWLSSDLTGGTEAPASSFGRWQSVTGAVLGTPPYHGPGASVGRRGH